MTPELELEDWVGRARGSAPTSGARRSWGLLPPAEQTGFPAEYFRYLPDAVGGRFPDGPRVAAVARGFRLVARASAAPMGPPPVDPVQSVRRSRLTNFRVLFAGTVDTREVSILPFNPQRSYLLLLNVGSSDMWISFDQAADPEIGIPLAATTGFYELEAGTVSEVRAFAFAFARIAVVEGLYFPALPA